MPHAPCPKEDLITAFIKHGEAEWGAANDTTMGHKCVIGVVSQDTAEDKEGSEPSEWWGVAKEVKNDDDVSCSDPSQWWGEAPEKTTAEKRSLTHWYKLESATS